MKHEGQRWVGERVGGARERGNVQFCFSMFDGKKSPPGILSCRGDEVALVLLTCCMHVSDLRGGCCGAYSSSLGGWRVAGSSFLHLLQLGLQSGYLG